VYLLFQHLSQTFLHLFYLAGEVDLMCQLLLLLQQELLDVHWGQELQIKKKYV
jgi:hypothetical protein